MDEEMNIEWHSTLVHEMCHLWQFDFGKYPRKAYHDKQWADKMIEIGLIPSSTGRPGGKMTGLHMNDYPDENGKFIKAFKEINERQLAKLKIPFKVARSLVPKKVVVTATDGQIGENNESEIPTETESLNGAKATYQCPCGFKVWGKPGLNIKCLTCDEQFDRIK